MESKKIVNLIFLLIFLTEIILGIICGSYFQIYSEAYSLALPCYWTSLLMIIITGFYAIIVKELPYLLAFCITNVASSLVFFDLRFRFDSFYNVYFSDPDNDKKIRVINIISTIACGLTIIFNILFIILFIIIMKKKYWRTTDKKSYLRQIFLPNDISEKNLESLRHLSLPNYIPNEDLESLQQIFGISKKDLGSLRQIFDISDKDLEESYITYKFYNFLLYITLSYVIMVDVIVITPLFNIVSISNIKIIILFILFLLPFFVLIFSLKIIKEESNVFMGLTYMAIMVQLSIIIYFCVIIRILLTILITTSILLLLLFINVIKCHRNFGKKLKLYLKFDPNLNEAYNYYSDDDKNKKDPKKLKEYWNSFKSFFLDFVIGEKKMIK